MKTHPAILAMAVMSGGITSAQKLQNDSLGSPTPRPSQNSSPNTNEPNVPGHNTTGQAGSMERAAPPKANSSPTGPGSNLSSGNAGTEKTNGVTPGGLTPD